MTLPSCRKNQCDFNSYIQKIEIIDSSFTFRSFGKLEVHPESNRICDSAFFGKDLRAIGVIKKDKELYSVLLHSYNKMFLETLDQNGHIMDKIELVRNNGVVNDSTSILSTYILQKTIPFAV
ncbi:MAG: hypothetical protein IPL10_20565 [Bacteroidetes bacterium]|nr:hypothetical protein [Bacteroidota bacterium]